jgi:hypothetical protein
VLPTSAVLGAAQGTEPAKENAANAAGATTPDISVADRPTYLFFNAAEVLFIEAACERLIPADESGTGALGAVSRTILTSNWAAPGVPVSDSTAAGLQILRSMR